MTLKHFSLLPLFVAGLYAETRTLFPDVAEHWSQAGPGKFEIADGVATATGGMGLYWFAEHAYANACFEVEFMMTDASQNSGIFVRFPDPGDDPWVAVRQGYEIQICNTGEPSKTMGSIYDLQAAANPKVKIGEWNTYKILTVGDQIAVILNDELINVFECQEGRGDVKGHFGLQNHDDGSAVKFRKVEVHELNADSLLTALTELEIPRSALIDYRAASAPEDKPWYDLADHGPAFLQTFGDFYQGEKRWESALKGMVLSYSALPNRVALFNTENLSLISATDAGLNLLNTPWAQAHGNVNVFQNKDSFLFNVADGPVWADETGSFEDKRPLKGYGNHRHLKFSGYFRHGNNVILDYAVNGTRILDSVSDHGDGLVRYLEVAPHEQQLTVRLLDDAGSENFTLLTKAIGGGIQTTNREGSHFLRLNPSGKTTKVALLYANSEGHATPEPAELSALIQGGPGISPETFEVKPLLDSSGKAWLVDRIPLPPVLAESPYHARVRVSDLDFYEDGDRAILSTWDGDIWMLTGLQEFKKLTWKRYATGFFEPLGIKIVDGIPYVSGRDGIYQLHDLNDDGEADHFKVFNNEVYLSNNFHEFQFGLETDREGNFYFAKASPVLNGGRGFDKILPHNGVFVKISADGKRFETIGTGLRAPGGIGIGPKGEITSGENEGTWQPCCKINYYEPERGMPFFGVEDTRQGNTSPFTEPLCYLPMSVDNSGGSQVWVPDHAKIGIAPGELIHLSYGQSAIYHVLREKVDDGFYQGGVVKLPLKLTSSAQRAAFHPDGSMYVVGFRGWQTNAANEAGLQRIRYDDSTENPLPVALSVTATGIKLTFDQELDEELATDPTSFAAQRWKYVRSKQYGSGQFSVDEPDLEAERRATEKEMKSYRKRDQVTVTAATLSEDSKSVFLTIKDHKPSQQFKLEYDLESSEGDELFGTIHSTIHRVPAP